jgi:hypothetical protein
MAVMCDELLILITQDVHGGASGGESDNETTEWSHPNPLRDMVMFSTYFMIGR